MQEDFDLIKSRILQSNGLNFVMGLYSIMVHHNPQQMRV